MSSGRPPQLQIPLPSETGTSFKRSFEQYGFDLDTPLSGGGSGEASSSGGAGTGSGNTQNKRARSASSLSNSDGNANMSGPFEVALAVGSSGSGSGTGSIPDNSLTGLSSNRSISPADSASTVSSSMTVSSSLLVSSSAPPRLPTPGPFQEDDIQMAVLVESQPTPTIADSSETYRMSLERFNEFDSQISAIRRPPPRSNSPPRPIPSVLNNPQLHVENYSGQQMPNLAGTRRYEEQRDRRRAALFDMLEANSGNHLPPPSNYVAEERVPSALPMPRLSPSPLFSQGELGWWPPHPTNITEPTPPNRTSSHIRPSNSSATPAAPDYLPPRNWFNHPPTSQSAVVGGTRVVRRATHSIDTDSSDEEFPPIDRDYGSNDSALHLLASQQRHQPPYRADVSPGLPLPERSSVERPRPGMSPSNNRHVNHARNVLQARAEAEHMFSSGDAEIPGRRSRLPRISTSDFDFNLRGSLFTPPMQRPSEFASHSRSDLAAEPQASQGYPISTNNMPSPSYTEMRRSSQLHSLPSSHELSNVWSDVPSRQANNQPSRRPPSQLRSHTSHITTSNSLVSENAAEIRRSMARAQMLESLPLEDNIQDEDLFWLPRTMFSRGSSEAQNLDAAPESFDHGREWRSGSSAHSHNHATFPDSNDNEAQTHPITSSVSPSVRSMGGLRDSDHRFHSISNSPENSRFAANPSPGSSGRNAPNTNGHDRDELDVPLNSHAPSSSLPGYMYANRDILERSHDFLSAVDAQHGRSTLRPPRPRSPVAWEDVINFGNDTSSHSNGAFSRAALELAARARRRSSLVDVGLFRSPSPTPSVEQAPRSPAERPRATSMSTYGDLNTYHEGPFRASLQRFADLERNSRSSHLEPLSDEDAPTVIASTRPTPPPSLPPLRFDSDDDLLTSSARPYRLESNYETARSSITHPEHGFPRMLREARLGINPFADDPRPENPSSRVGANLLTRDIDSRAEQERLASWRGRLMARSTFTEQPSGLARDYLSQHGRGQISTDSHAGTPATVGYRRSENPDDVSSQPLPRGPPLPFPRSADVNLEMQNARIQERVNTRMINIHARVRAHMDARAQARMQTEGTNTPSTNGFVEAMDILSADGLRSSTQRQLVTRYHQERSTDSDRGPTVHGDFNDNGFRFSPARARYARRGRIYHPLQPVDATLASRAGPSSSIRSHRSSSHSPARDGSSSERLPTAATVIADRAARLRATRERVQRDREFMLEDFPRFDLPNAARRLGSQRNLGDYVRDEDFDTSYEGLVSLASTLGEVRPRATPKHVIAALPAGFYKDWQTTDSDQRCPICLDDYKPLDPVLKLSDCTHWLHKGCLEQWLQNANTCPVCRKVVKGPSRCPRHRPVGQTTNRSLNRPHGDYDSQHGEVPGASDAETPPWRLWE